MASLVSNSEKLLLSSEFNNLHDTFSRLVTVYKTPERVIISSDSNYNFLYNDQEAIEVAYIPISGQFECRIQWQDPSKMMGWPEIREEVRGNFCRIKAKKDFVDFISDAEKIEIDTRPVQSVGSSRPHGLFNVDFYTLFFKESE
jgi:hypothetical protein